MNINKLAKQIHQNNIDKGFYEGEKNIGEMLALVHSEVSEALEADRNYRYSDTEFTFLFKQGVYDSDDSFSESFTDCVKDTFEDELADVMIRVMDLAAFKGIDLESHINAKLRYNRLRPYKHGKKY